MNTGQKRFALGALFALIAFALFININSAWSDKHGHGWHIVGGTIAMVIALIFLARAIGSANRKGDDTKI